MRATLLAGLVLGTLVATADVAVAGCVEYGGVTISTEPSVTVHSVSVNPRDCIGPR